MKYVIYLRVSTTDQDNRTQELMCLDFLKKYHGDEKFSHLIFQEKISAMKKPLDKRLQLKAAISCLEEGDVLVGQKVDRLARNAYEAHVIKNDLENIGAGILMIDQPGIQDCMMFSIYAGLAEKEGQMIKSRIKSKMEAKRQRSERISRIIPYGYHLDEENLIPLIRNDKVVNLPGKLIPIPEEQLIIDQMNQLHKAGLSYRQIVKRLTDQGVMNRQGDPFHHMSVYKILSR